MKAERMLALVATCLISVWVPASAQGLTVGDLPTTDPGACVFGTSTEWVLEVSSTTAPYAVPPGGGVINSWSTSFGPPGADVELVVATRLGASAMFVVRGTDFETLPTPLAADNVSTFTLAHPIAVQTGDVIGLNYFGGSDTRCLFSGAGSDHIGAGSDPLYPGGMITAISGGIDELVNVSVNLVQSADVSLTAAVTPSAITRGDLAALTFQIRGSSPAPADFTDTLPAGLTPVSASATNGSCSIAGQSVSCALGGAPSTVYVAAQGTRSGMYTDSGGVTSALPDPNPANNSASATLAVIPANPSPRCTVPRLRGAPLSVAKAVLRLVHCAVGQVKISASRTVPKGDVISTKPGAGAGRPAGTKVAISVSGKPKARKKHHA